MKVCSKCKRLLDETCFNKRGGNRQNQLQTYCRDCKKEYDFNNKERRKLFYKKQTKEEYRLIYKNNREKKLYQRKINRLKNPEKHRNYNRKYRLREGYKILKNRNSRRRYATNVNERLRKNLCNRIRIALFTNNTKKKNELYNLLGCNITDLKLYLESKFKEGMSWENYGKWHIDHVRPCASYDLSIVENQFLCFNFKNLQPLWDYENLSKGSKYEN
jgi:hypothetical protein